MTTEIHPSSHSAIANPKDTLLGVRCDACAREIRISRFAVGSSVSCLYCSSPTFADRSRTYLVSRSVTLPLSPRSSLGEIASYVTRRDSSGIELRIICDELTRLGINPETAKRALRESLQAEISPLSKNHRRMLFTLTFVAVVTTLALVSAHLLTG